MEAGGGKEREREGNDCILMNKGNPPHGPQTKATV